MNVLIVGGAGLLGSALKAALAAKGQTVTTAGRSVTAAGRSAGDVPLDFSKRPSVDDLRGLVRGFDIVINCAGILIERGSNSFEAVHAQGPAALFKACELERVARIVHISAIGAGQGLHNRYIQSKEAAEAALAHSMVDWVCVRPSLLLSAQAPAYQSFAALARWPVQVLPGWRQPGAAPLQPLALADAAQAIANIALHAKAHARTIELAGPQTVSYRELMSAFSASLGRKAFTFGLPWWLMRLIASASEFAFKTGSNPRQKTAISADGLRLLRSGSVSQRNEIQRWLGTPAQTVHAMLQRPTAQASDRTGALFPS
jgi:uncharacterized protein YbjT (DUF2867 family)